MTGNTQGDDAGDTVATQTMQVVGIEDAWIERDTAQGLWHRQGYASVGFKGDIFFGPKNVSFQWARLPATAAGSSTSPRRREARSRAARRRRRSTNPELRAYYEGAIAANVERAAAVARARHLEDLAPPFRRHGEELLGGAYGPPPLSSGELAALLAEYVTDAAARERILAAAARHELD